MSDNIKVAIKVRPLIKREMDECLPIQWLVENNTITKFDPETRRPAVEQFSFDHVFDMKQRNVDVFDKTVKPIVEAAMKGFNGTIFAYGQTGSGKTYTMMGTNDELGVIPLTVDYIFNYIQNDPSREFLLRVSYIEIYNENINDLLDTERTDLKIKEDHNGNIMVDCKEEVSYSPGRVIDIMRRGNKNRRTGETNMNDRSSRSHTIFRITIESCEKDDPDGTACEAHLNLIDLAGSEKARQTGATGERFNEGRYINLSLSTLSLVIKQLSESTNLSKQGYVNYRDSKLTRILQPSLAGNAMTTIICAVTPAADEETKQTLAFAARAKGVKTKPKVNECISDKALLKRVRNQVAKLQSALEHAKSELQEKDRLILEERINFLKNNILSKHKDDNSKNKIRRRRTWGGSSAEHCNLNKSTLPTINEIEFNDIQGFKNSLLANSKTNNIPEINLMNQTFQTSFTDFELRLIEDEQAKNRESNDSNGLMLEPTVTYRRNTYIDDTNINLSSPVATPEKSSSDNSTMSTGTPKSHLRTNLRNLKSEFDQLREFTTLEKQFCQEYRSTDGDYLKHRKDMDSLAKSLEDSELMIMDLNKKYSELQSEYAILSSKYEDSTDQCKSLTKDVEYLSSLKERVEYLESENNNYKTKMKTFKSLENELESEKFSLEMLKTKFKNKEKELKKSLEIAWKEFIDPNEKKKLVDIAHLQSVIEDYKEKLKSFESQSSNSTGKSVNELEETLKISEEENSNLKEQMQELSSLLEKSSLFDKGSKHSIETSVLKSQIEELSKSVGQMSQFEDSLEFSKEENLSLKAQIEELSNRLDEFSQTEEALKHSEEENSALNVKIEELTTRVEELRQFEDTLKHSKEENLLLKTQIEELSKQLEQLGQFKEDNLMLKTKIEELTKNLEHVSDFEVALQDSKEENLSLKTQIEELSKRLEQLDQSKAENLMLQTKIEELSKRLEELSQSEEALKYSTEEVYALKQQSEELSKRLELLQESEKTLKCLEEENSTLKLQSNEFINRLKLLFQSDDTVSTGIPLINQLENQIGVFKKRITELEEIIATKEREFNKNLENIEKLTETNDKLRTYEVQIDAMKVDIERLQSDINEKTSEVTTMKGKIEELIIINEEIEKKSKNEMSEYQTKMETMENELKAAISDVELKDTEILSLKELTKETTDQELELKKMNEQFLDDINNKKAEILKLEELHSSNLHELELENKELHDKIHELQLINEELKEQLNNNQSEKTLLDGEKLSLQNLIIEKDEELKNIQKLEIQLDFVKSEKSQLEYNLSELRTNLNETILELNSCQINKSEMDNLQGYNKELQSYTKNLEDENEILKQDLKDINNRLEILINDKEYLEKEKINLLNQIKNLEKSSQSVSSTDLISSGFNSDATLNVSKNISELKLKITEPVNTEKLSKTFNKIDDVDSSSIFVNGNYSTDLSVTTNDLTLSENTHYETDIDNTIGIIQLNQSNISIDELLIILDKKNPNELKEIIQQLDKNRKMLLSDLETKENETKEVQNGLNELKAGMEKLQQTVMILTAENSELGEKLTIEKERNREIQFNLDEINKLKNEMKVLEEDKMIKEDDIKTLEKELEDARSMLVSNNKLQKKIEVLESKIKELIQENIELSEDLMSKVEELDNPKLNETQENQIKKLKSVNDKVSDIKLPSCNQCAHLIELNQTRKALKHEVKTVNRRLNDLREKFHQECAETEILRSKAKEDISFCDSTFNESSINVVEVSYVESKVFQLHEELGKLEDDHDKLLAFYDEKYGEKNKLKNVDNNSSFSEHLISFATSSPNRSQRESRIDKIKNELEKNKIDLHDLKKCVNDVSDAVKKLKNRKQISSEAGVNTDEKWNSNTSAEVENLDCKVKDLTECLLREEETKSLLKLELDELKSTVVIKTEEITMLNNKIDDYKKNIEVLDCCVKDLKDKLNTCQKENEELANKLKEINFKNDKINLETSDCKMEVCDDSFSIQSNNNKQLEELETVRERIKKELFLLKLKNNENLNNKNVSELFNVFLKAIMVKEEEVLTTLMNRNEYELNKLEEDKKQLIDMEKRTSIWAKTLENEIEKLQNDLSNEQIKNNELKLQIDKLNNELMDSDYQKQQLKEKISLIENDFQTLQNDFDKQTKILSLNDSSGEQKKIIQQKMDINELQNQDKLDEMEEMEEKYKEEIKVLKLSLDKYKTENMDLKSNLEGLEVNEKHLKSLIDLKTNELSKTNGTIEILKVELKQLTEEYEQLNETSNIDKRKIEEITGLLKKKSDTMSEYKTKYETINPEYEILKEQASNRQLKLEKYRSEIENLREKNEKELSLMKDELDKERIKSNVLNKQLTELTNKYTEIQSSLDCLKDKCEVLQCENERLLRKTRNSTNKLEAEREIEELKEKYDIVTKNLEGASNRITELIKIKNELLVDNTELKSKYDMLINENNDNKMKFNNVKSFMNNNFNLQDKYDELLKEKNQILLDLESKKLIIINLEKQMNELNVKNRELDDENEDMSCKIQEMDTEVTQLQCKLYELDSTQENLIKELNECKNNCSILKIENEKLKNNLVNANNVNSISHNDKHRMSPVQQHKKRRSDTFDKNRKIDCNELNDVDLQCQNDNCIKQIEELERKLAIEEAKCKTLKFQIEASEFPLKNRIQQYEKALIDYKNRNLELKKELNLGKSVKKDCDRCINWKDNHKDQSIQVMIEEKKEISFSSRSTSGLIAEEVMVQQKMNKLEQDKDRLKQIIGKYKLKVKELENKKEEQEAKQLGLQSSNLSLRNPLLTSMKENLPSKINRKFNI